MKLTTKKLLTLLYTEKNKKPFNLPLEYVNHILPDLTVEGRRSLMYLLEKKNLTYTVKVNNQTWLASSDTANEAIRRLFPSLQTENDQQVVWNVCIFKTPPKGDPQFRYLRKKLLSTNAYSLSRGVYIWHGKTSTTLLHLFETMYLGSIVVLTVDQWLFGFDNPIVLDHFELKSTVDAYSSISRECDLLLSNFDVKKRLNGKNKLDIIKIYTRWFDSFSADSGLVGHYFPQVLSGLAILQKIQQLVSLDRE